MNANKGNLIILIQHPSKATCVPKVPSITFSAYWLATHCHTSPVQSRTEAIGKVVRTQDGAEIVSQLLAADASATPFVVTSLLPDLPFLASHPHGAGVISDLFEACRRAPDHGASTIPAMTQRLQGSLLRLTRDRWGCRVMQAALEDAAPDFQQAFANELQGKALKLCQHLHANFVLQKYVELVPASSAGFLLEELTPHAMEVAVHVYGCRVLQRLIEHCPKEPQLASLLESVLSAVPQIEKLLKDPFGSNLPDFTGLVPIFGGRGPIILQVEPGTSMTECLCTQSLPLLPIVIAYAKVVCPTESGRFVG